MKSPYLFLLIILLPACSSLTLNSISEGDDKNLMLKGHDPVAYFTAGKHVLGEARFKIDHQGATYRFASETNRQEFIKNPARYAPQYGGFCANGIVYAIPWGGDPDSWKIINDKLYIFGGEASKRYFLMNEQRNLALADQYWQSEVNGANSFWQRWQRLTFRVPHYKTGQELETEWQARQNKK